MEGYVSFVQFSLLSSCEHSKCHIIMLMTYIFQFSGGENYVILDGKWWCLDTTENLYKGVTIWKEIEWNNEWMDIWMK